MFDIVSYLMGKSSGGNAPAPTPTKNLLKYSSPDKIVAQALCEDYDPNKVGINGVYFYGTPTVSETDGSIILHNGVYARTPIFDHSMTVYGVIKESGEFRNYQRFMSVYYASVQYAEALFCSPNGTDTSLIYSTFNTDSAVSDFVATDKHLLVIAIDKAHSLATFYLDGTKLTPDKTIGSIGDVFWCSNGAGQYMNGSLYYASVVSEYESSEVIINNSNEIMDYYGIGV